MVKKKTTRRTVKRKSVKKRVVKRAPKKRVVRKVHRSPRKSLVRKPKKTVRKGHSKKNLKHHKKSTHHIKHTKKPKVTSKKVLIAKPKQKKDHTLFYKIIGFSAFVIVVAIALYFVLQPTGADITLDIEEAVEIAERVPECVEGEFQINADGTQLFKCEKKLLVEVTLP